MAALIAVRSSTAYMPKRLAFAHVAQVEIETVGADLSLEGAETL